MFEGFARVWTPVALSADLRRDKPLGIVVAGTPVALFRDGEGRAAAMLDRCPHRGVSLSLGEVRGGCLACPFHGWEFDAKGSVCRVPWNPDAKLSTLRGVTFPTRELAGQVWIYTDPVEEPPSEPEVHASILAPGVRVSGFAVEWKTHWTRAMENMLDWPHLPFIHRRTIGRELQKKSASKMEIAWEEHPWGAHTSIKIDGRDEPGALDFRWPNQMNLHISPPGKLLLMLVSCVPIDDGRTRMLLTMARNFMTSPLFDIFFHKMNARIADEDRAVVESSHPAIVPPAGEERSVRTDGPTLAFRKRYFAELHASSARAP